MRLSKKNIMIVDDDASHRLLLRKILETAGCIVEEAESVVLALEKVQTKLPDLIVLDLNMPEHDGFSFLKFRAQNRLMQSIPVLVQSSSTKRPTVEKALAMGANQFLEKPLKANLVLQKLRYLFYSQENYTYQYPKDQEPELSAEINARVTAISEAQLKVSSSVKFEKDKPIEVKIEDYLKSGGSSLISRVENRRLEVDSGLYSQVLTLVGVAKEEKERMKKWQKKL